MRRWIYNKYYINRRVQLAIERFKEGIEKENPPVVGKSFVEKSKRSPKECGRAAFIGVLGRYVLPSVY